MDFRYSERLATKPRLDYKTMEQRSDSFGEKRPRVDMNLEPEAKKELELELEAEAEGYNFYCHPIVLVNFFMVVMVGFLFAGFVLDSYSILQYLTPTQHAY